MHEKDQNRSLSRRFLLEPVPDPVDACAGSEAGCLVELCEASDFDSAQDPVL